MQTFLPYPSFADSAAVLDYRRLGKQRVEAKQILIALGVSVGEHAGNAESRWRHHPAVRMWRGFERCLCNYAMVVCREWRDRGFNDTLLEQFEHAADPRPLEIPRWLGHEAVHESHRSNLLRKNSDHYGQYGWVTPCDLPYVWPV